MTVQYLTTYDGTNLLATDIGSEMSVTLGSNWATNSNYDWFVATIAARCGFCTGPAWTSDTGPRHRRRTTELERVRASP